MRRRFPRERQEEAEDVGKQSVEQATSSCSDSRCNSHISAAGDRYQRLSRFFVEHVHQLLIVVTSIHIVICPFTKVEESFNMQATHDILVHFTNTDAYDHHEFPGVVPRTFIGPLLLAAGSWPAVQLIQLFVPREAGLSNLCTQLAVRLCLAAAVSTAFGRCVRAIADVFGVSTAMWLALITISQFHWPFYAGRTLPNSLAMPFVLLAVEGWLRCRHRQMIVCSGVAVLLFRCELAGFLGPMVLVELWSGRLSLKRLLVIALPAASVIIACTVSIDSLMWRRLVWPEAEVFWFNAVLNRSHAWGVSPLLWYLYSALPRSLAASLFPALVGLFMDSCCRRVLLPALLYIAAYSLLPHKELRFIIYTIPLFNLAAARACDHLWRVGYEATTANSGWFQRCRGYVVMMALVGHLALNMAFMILLVTVSRLNYPGAQALHRLQLLEPSSLDSVSSLAASDVVHVHIDSFTAQTGVTRFLQWRAGWIFNKTENMSPDSPEIHQFTHLLVGGCSQRDLSAQPYFSAFDVVDRVSAFERVQVEYFRWPPLHIKLRPAVFLLRRKLFHS